MWIFDFIYGTTNQYKHTTDEYRMNPIIDRKVRYTCSYHHPQMTTEYWCNPVLWYRGTYSYIWEKTGIGWVGNQKQRNLCMYPTIAYILSWGSREVNPHVYRGEIWDTNGGIGVSVVYSPQYNHCHNPMHSMIFWLGTGWEEMILALQADGGINAV